MWLFLPIFAYIKRILCSKFTYSLILTSPSHPFLPTKPSQNNLSCNDQNLRQSELKTFRKFWRLWDWFEFVSHQLVAKWWTWKGEAHGDSADNLVNKLLQIFLGGWNIFVNADSVKSCLLDVFFLKHPWGLFRTRIPWGELKVSAQSVFLFTMSTEIPNVVQT